MNWDQIIADNMEAARNSMNSSDQPVKQDTSTNLQKNIISEKYISDIDSIIMDQDNKRLIIYTDTKGELVIDYDNDIDLKKDYEALKKINQ